MDIVTSSRKKTKSIGLISAIALGISSIIGSGWLFAPYNSAMVAGPASIISWIVGAVIITLLGLCFAEIAALYPRRGLSAIIPTLSHNKYFAFPFAIANWLGIVAVIALEADATVQYLINLFPHIEPYLFSQGELTGMGDSISVMLVIFFAIANYWGASAMVKTNNIFAVIKITIPIFIATVMILAAFHPTNFTYINHTFMPYGYNSIFSAILTSGIIVAFNGFQTVISFSSEIKRPYRTIPLSVAIAVLFCLGVYLLIQVAFIGGMPTQLLQTGWRNIQLNAPIVQILGLMGLGIFTTVIYFGATAAPCGTAIAFTGTSTRMFTAMSRNEQMPAYFNAVHPMYGVSRRSLMLNAVLAIVFLLLFRSWSNLAQVLSLFHVISYLPVPIALWVLRNKISPKKYLFRLPLGKIIALSLFAFFTYLFTLAKLRIILELMAIFSSFLLVFILLSSRTLQDLMEITKQLWSLVLYFVALVALTALSPAHSNLFSQGQFAVVVCLASLVMFIGLLQTERHDVEIVHSSVQLYRN